MNIKVIYGSTTGMTEIVASKIASALSTNSINIASANTDDFAADLLVLGSSTWGFGDLQDDWMSRLEEVKPLLAGKKVVVFGLGDSLGFSDTFAVAADQLADAARSVGATVVGDCFRFDEANEPHLTDERVDALVKTVKAAL